MNAISNIKHLIYTILPPPIKFRLHTIRNRPLIIWGGETFDDNFNLAVNKFLPASETKNKKSVRKLKKDMLNCWMQYGVKPVEYFYFGFDQNQDKEYRGSFVTDRLKDECCMRTMALEKFRHDLTNKYNFYLLNKTYFKRNVYLLNHTMSETEFVDTLKKHNCFFVKDLAGSFGKNSMIIKYSSDEQAKDLYQHLMSSPENQFCLEELIRQSEEMSQWNESSVNTVRVPSIRCNDQYHIIAPFFRAGRKGAIIDNAGGGGILAAVDPNTGILISDGYCESNIFYENHPDTNKKFKGWQIPQWDELKKLTAEIHQGMPDHKYIGFDFALTDEGWVLIEGNWGQLLWQYATRNGIKQEFLKLMK